MLNKEIFYPRVETERKPSVGVALAIVRIDPRRNGENITLPMLWTNIEKKTNPVTEKIAGQISLPGETWRPPEDLGQNIYGAVAEEFSGNDLQISNLWYVKGKSYMPEKVSIGGRPADLVVLFFTGSLEIENAPIATDEVSPHRWMTVDELLGQRPYAVRKFTVETAILEQEQRVIGQCVDAFNHFPLSRVPVLSFRPSDVSSAQQFCEIRQGRKDVDFLSIPPLKR